MRTVRYRKKPVEVDTVQWTGVNIDELIDFTGGEFLLVSPNEGEFAPDVTAKVYDRLHDTWVGVKTGQHIVRGVNGEFYPIDEAVLAETYEPAAAPSAPAGRDLRDRIAQAVQAAFLTAPADSAIGEALADAVLAVLPARTDQTAEIRAAAFKTAALYVRGHSADERFGHASVSTALCTMSDELWRMADETQQAETALHLGNKANAEDCPACAVERRNLEYPFLCPAEPADQAQQAGEADRG